MGDIAILNLQRSMDNGKNKQQKTKKFPKYSMRNLEI